MVLVGAGIAVLLLGHTLLKQKNTLTSPLSRGMLILTALLMLQIVNPKQGGLAVGIAGAMLVIVPTFWFWIGQAYGSVAFLQTLFFRIIVPISIVALAMGAIQLTYGYLPHQLAWYKVAGYKALGDSIDTLRPLSIFPNITEYLVYVSILVGLSAASLFRSAEAPAFPRKVAAILIPIAIISLFLAGSRGPVVMSLFIVILLWAIQGSSVASWVPRLAIVSILGGMGFVWTLTQVSEMEVEGGGRVHANMQRQAQLVETGGTANTHANLAIDAVKHGISKEPFGLGVGAITLAASKFGGNSFNSEKDITNMFIVGGVLGGVVYLGVVILAATASIRYWIHTRSLIALSIFAVLTVTGLMWLHPGHYVTTPLVWLVIGVLDRLWSNTQAALPPPQ
jgi:hypothetical protein